MKRQVSVVMMLGIIIATLAVAGCVLLFGRGQIEAKKGDTGVRVNTDTPQDLPFGATRTGDK